MTRIRHFVADILTWIALWFMVAAWMTRPKGIR